jgi:hypothetical protein
LRGIEGMQLAGKSMNNHRNGMKATQRPKNEMKEEEKKKNKK